MQSKQLFNAESIPYLCDLIESQKEILPFDLLGRSLSYNPYPPRFFEIFPTLLDSVSLDSASLDSTSLDSTSPFLDSTLLGKLCALQIRAFDFADFAHLQSHINAKNVKIIFLDIARDSVAKPSGEGLECISYLRHYTDSLIVLKDCFLDSYQILQAVVFGADALCFSHFSLQSRLKELVDFASHLGLASLLESQNLADIKNGIFAKVSGFYLLEKCFGELASLIPKRKIICADVECVQNLAQHNAKNVSKVLSRVDFVLQDFAL
ncbi:hypothetical protein [Helicobacter sp. T3_23-1056]